MFDFDPVILAIRFPVVLMALTMHEFSHAYFAYQMGDPTALRMGRCTLNPLKHLDPLGTICLMFAPIGWAKPVPINPMNFRDWRKGILVSTAAGPGSNLVQAVALALLLRALLAWGDQLDVIFGKQAGNISDVAFLMLLFGVMINVGLAIFNLLPLYPLDGFHIMLQLQRIENQQKFADTAKYGPFVILAVVLIGNTGKINILGSLIGPPVRLLLAHVAGLPDQWIPVF